MDFLQQARNSNDRSNPSKIVSVGKSLLSKRLGTEGWNVREQVFVAALDINELGVCQSMLEELKEQFPDSQRVMRLEGLYFEITGKNRDASAIYDAMIEKNANNTIGMKRKVCLLKASGRLNEAIAQLVKYLDVFQADAEGFKELALLYAEAGNFKSCSFCLEEVILINPHSYLSHLAYAESLYTIGGEVSNLLDARKYFCHSLTVKKRHPRSLWGLAVSTKALQVFYINADSKNNSYEDDIESNKEINAKTLDFLCNQRLPPGMDEIVKAAAARLSCS